MREPCPRSRTRSERAASSSVKSQTTVLWRLHGYRSANRSRDVAQPVQSSHSCDRSGEARMRRRDLLIAALMLAGYRPAAAQQAAAGARIGWLAHGDTMPRHFFDE